MDQPDDDTPRRRHLRRRRDHVLHIPAQATANINPRSQPSHGEALEIPEAILKRKSIRAYAPKGLTDEEIETLIKAAISAPSAGNMQPWGFVAVRDRDVKEALVEASHGQSFIATAPVIIVVCTEAARTTPRYKETGRDALLPAGHGGRRREHHDHRDC